MSPEAGANGAGRSGQEGPAANPGLLSEHERSVLLALMLLRQTVRLTVRWLYSSVP